MKLVYFQQCSQTHQPQVSENIFHLPAACGEIAVHVLKQAMLVAICIIQELISSLHS